MAEPIQTDASGSLTHRQIMLVLSGLMLGMFLAALDQTIVSAAMRTIADKLNGQTNQAWATTAYLVTATVSTPLYGKLSDMYGRKKFYLAAITIFLAGSALSGMSNSMIELAGFRAIQGAGAGGLMALAFAIIGDMVSPRDRAKYQGYFMAVFAVSSVAGPVLGGLLAGTNQIFGIDGWRWVFYVNVPIGLVALVVVSKVLNLPHTPKSHKIDYLGATLLISGIGALLVVAEQGRAWGWGSSGAIALYVLGTALLAAFVWQENRVGDEAILPLRLFRHPTFSMASLLSFIVGMGMFGGIICLPLYLQIVKGYTPTHSGLALLPMMLGMMTFSMASGITIGKTGRYKIFPIVGTGILIVALLGLSRVHADTSYGMLVPLMLMIGAGLGLCMQTLVLASQNSVDPTEMGVATAAATFFRSMGGTFGTALFLTVFFSGAQTNLTKALAPITPAGGGGGAVGDKLNNSAAFLSELPEQYRHLAFVGLSNAMDHVFLLAAIVVLPAFVLSFFLKEVKLRMQSGLEAQAAAKAAIVREAEAEGAPAI